MLEFHYCGFEHPLTIDPMDSEYDEAPIARDDQQSSLIVTDLSIESIAARTSCETVHNSQTISGSKLIAMACSGDLAALKRLKGCDLRNIEWLFVVFNEIHNRIQNGFF
jgi:hypothetical protein